MFAYVLNNIVQFLIQPGVEFTIDGVTYPGNWIQLSSTSDQQSLGIYEVVYAQRPNDTYYWVTQEAPVFQSNQVIVNFTSTPKDLFTCQNNQVTQINAQAYSLLQPSDWLVIRSVESGGTFPVPVSWNQWRQTIRNEASAGVNAVTACTTIEQLAALPPIAWTPDPNNVPAVDAGVQ
jgi:hypothetical protein